MNIGFSQGILDFSLETLVTNVAYPNAGVYDKRSVYVDFYHRRDELTCIVTDRQGSYQKSTAISNTGRFHNVSSTPHFSCPVVQLSTSTRAILTLCLAQYLWCGTNVLDNWQLAVLLKSERREFNAHMVHDNFSVPLWVICVYNKHVYRQSQVRKSTDSGAKWAECSLIIGTGCRVQVF